MSYIYRYFREENGDIYDRETGKTIIVQTEIDRGDYYVVNLYKDTEWVIYKEDIEERR